MVREGHIAINEAFTVVIFCINPPVLLRIYYSAIARLCFIAWQCRSFPHFSYSDVLFKKNSMVKFIKMKKELFIKNDQPDSFSVKARLRSFRYAFDGLNSFFATQHNAIIHLLITILALAGAVF